MIKPSLFFCQNSSSTSQNVTAAAAAITTGVMLVGVRFQNSSLLPQKSGLFQIASTMRAE
jgi:hypothetical protein